jgi:arylformamidase
MSVVEQSAPQGQAAAAPRQKGPLVFLDYDQAELDAAYNQAAYAPNQEQIRQRREVNSNIARKRLGEPDRIAYGPTEIEKLDIYGCGRAGAPIMIFTHGGAWKNGMARDHAFAAELFVRAGAHFVVPDFIQVEAAGGSLLTMADQVRRAIAWVHKNAAQFGGDPNRLYVAGHSSGAHLTGCALITDWQAGYNMPADIIKGGICISGMYDLKPVRLSARSAYVKFDDKTEQELSSIRHLARLKAPVIVAYGTNETPEFQRQGREFAAAVKAAGKPVELIVGEHYNHFELPETLANPYGLLGRAALRLMKLVR